MAYFLGPPLSRIVLSLGPYRTASQQAGPVSNNPVKEVIMQFNSTKLVIAAALALAAGAAHAQQHQQFGRDSVYAVPGASSSNEPGQDRVYPVRSHNPSAAGSVSTGGSIAHFGRDSVYANQMPEPTTRLTATVAGPQRFGRDSLYAGPFQTGPAPKTDTAVGTSDSKGKGG
jgi:hypothetical protein